MHLREVNAAVGQANARYPLAFAPTTAPLQLSKSLDFPNPGADGKRLHVGDFADDREEHTGILPTPNEGRPADATRERSPALAAGGPATFARWSNSPSGRRPVAVACPALPCKGFDPALYLREVKRHAWLQAGAMRVAHFVPPRFAWR